MSRDYRNFLVTGGMGFIGSNFIRLILGKKHIQNVINIDNLSDGSNVANLQPFDNDSRLKNIFKSINDEEVYNIIEKYNVDCIVHFAAESHVDRSIEDPNSFIDTNINGTLNLLNASLEYSKIKPNFHFHHVSTDEVYGSLSQEDPAFTELNQYMPNSPYSASKAASDHLVRAWHHTYGLKVTTSNCSNNYGPNQFPEKLIPVIIKSAITGSKIPIYGDGKNIRDWLYVEDHCKAIFKIIGKGEFGETYNIGGKNEISNIAIVNKICDLLEIEAPLSKPSPYTNKKLDLNSYKDLIVYVDDRLGHDFRYSINPKKIETDLKWFPSEDFSTGISKTIKWYLSNIEWLKEING